MKKNLLSAALLVCAFFTSLQAETVAQVAVSPAFSISDETRVHLKCVDNSFCFFKYFLGCKYPYLSIVDEATYTVKTLLCGTRSDDEVSLVKNADQLRNLAVVRSTVYSPDANVKFDKIYKGYRETLLGQAVELTLDMTSILPEKEYPGRALVDEYKSCMPMKWVLGDIKAFRAVRDYMLKEFEKIDLAPPVQKPLLLLEFEKKAQLFDEVDGAFLATYFELADPLDEDVRIFYKNCQKTLTRATVNIGSARPVGQTFGEMFMSTLEKPSDGFKPEVMALVGISLAAGFLLSELIKEPIKQGGKKFIGKAK
jgi:hypothetical protein